jgi:hypothetical protein
LSNKPKIRFRNIEKIISNDVDSQGILGKTYHGHPAREMNIHGLEARVTLWRWI